MSTQITDVQTEGFFGADNEPLPRTRERYYPHSPKQLAWTITYMTYEDTLLTLGDNCLSILAAHERCDECCGGRDEGNEIARHPAAQRVRTFYLNGQLAEEFISTWPLAMRIGTYCAYDTEGTTLTTAYFHYCPKMEFDSLVQTMRQGKEVHVGAFIVGSTMAIEYSEANDYHHTEHVATYVSTSEPVNLVHGTSGQDIAKDYKCMQSFMRTHDIKDYYTR